MTTKQLLFEEVLRTAAVEADEDRAVLEQMTKKQLRAVLAVAKGARKLALFDYEKDLARAARR